MPVADQFLIKIRHIINQSDNNRSVLNFQNMNHNSLLVQAKNGDIQAFHNLFGDFEKSLRAYVYRITGDRDDMNDLVQDTFLKSFDHIKSFDGRSNLKTWVFTIATRLCQDFLKKRKRWQSNVLDEAKKIAGERKDIRDYLKEVSIESKFDIREHIDFCFTCISKTLPIEQQISLLLKDIYDFNVKEISRIMNKGNAAIKHYLRFARQTMNNTFNERCSLVNKKGVCYQCSQLNDWLNPNHKTPKVYIPLTRRSGGKQSNQDLLKLRENLVKGIDPLEAKGADLHDVFMQLHRLATGETSKIERHGL